MTSASPAPAAGGALDRNLLAVAGVVVLGAVMSILDVTVVNVAINTLAASPRSPAGCCSRRRAWARC